jgi:hypothetical protein
MDISINGKPADITLEAEKTVGDLLIGIEKWLQGSESRISGLQINGKVIDALFLDEALGQDLGNIERIAITISTWQDIALEALFNAQEDLKVYESSSFDDQQSISNRWAKSVTAHFLAEQIPDIYALIHKTLSGEGLTPRDMNGLITERIRELMDPRTELKHLNLPVSDIVVRLEDLPLDMQTGKNGKVAETIQIFSYIVDKVFRLIRLMKLQGFALESLSIDAIPLTAFIDQFSTTLKELLAAYEVQDAVLVGDLAEYELAPRLLKLYAALGEG